MIVYKLIWTLWVCFALLSTGVLAQESGRHHQAVLDQHAMGSVNWTDGTVLASGFGIPPPNVAAAAAEAMAERAAMSGALRNLLEVIQGIQVDAETVVEKLIVTKDEINTRVRGAIRNAKVIERTVHPDRSVELKVSMRLHGRDSLTSSLLEEKTFSQSSLSANLPHGRYSGVVFDARGFRLKPVVFPTVVDEHKRLVYGPEVVSRTAAEDYGLAQYMLLENSKLSLPMNHVIGVVEKKKKTNSLGRVGAKPLRIKGLKRLGTFNANIMISNADVQKIRQDSSILRALNGAKVIIITDPLVAGVEGRLFNVPEFLVLDSRYSNELVRSSFSGNRKMSRNSRQCAVLSSPPDVLPVICDSGVYRVPIASDLRFLYGCGITTVLR